MRTQIPPLVASAAIFCFREPPLVFMKCFLSLAQEAMDTSIKFVNPHLWVASWHSKSYASINLTIKPRPASFKRPDISPIFNIPISSPFITLDDCQKANSRIL